MLDYILIIVVILVACTLLKKLAGCALSTLLFLALLAFLAYFFLGYAIDLPKIFHL